MIEQDRKFVDGRSLKPHKELMELKSYFSIPRAIADGNWGLDGFSDEAKEKAIERLSAKIKELSQERPTLENLLIVGLYAYAVEAIRDGNTRTIKELKEFTGS